MTPINSPKALPDPGAGKMIVCIRIGTDELAFLTDCDDSHELFHDKVECLRQAMKDKVING